MFIAAAMNPAYQQKDILKSTKMRPLAVGLMKIATTILAAMIGLVLPLTSNAASASEIAKGTDARYNNIKTLKADFTEVYSGPGISRSESGTLWLKKPGRM